MWATLEQSNDYLSEKLGADDWSIVPTTDLLTGKWSRFSEKTLSVSGGDASTLTTEDYIYYSGIISKITEIVSSSRIKIDYDLVLQSKYIYKVIDGASEAVTTQAKKIKCLTTAYRQISNSPVWLISNVPIEVLQNAQIEWAFWLFADLQTDEYKDIKNGLKRKKIDVLEWEYRDDALDTAALPGPQEAQDLLSSYLNPDFIAGGGAGNIFATM